MSYSDFTLEKLEQSFGLQISVSEISIFPETLLFPIIEPHFQTYIASSASFGENINTEKARSEFIIAPILVLLRTLYGGKMSVFSGVTFDVDKDAGLTGVPDFLLTQSGFALEIRAPVCAIVEAKKEAILPGIPQCVAELIAAHLFNLRKEAGFDVYYGAVTTGTNWRFLRYEPSQNQVLIDSTEILFLPLEKLLAVLLYAVQSPKPLIST